MRARPRSRAVGDARAGIIRSVASQSSSTDSAMARSERFELLEKLGEGSMGVVYAAYDKLRDMRVAVKTMRSVNARSLYRFKREFRALTELSHPNIIQLHELIAAGRRILVFSQFTSMLELVEAELASERIRYVKLTGQTEDRATPVERFQRGEVPVFLISLRAGGFGLNLTRADTVIHYDPWWNPAVESQATDRAHRIGQDKPVFVYRLIAADTVEERILALQARKRELADALFDESGQSLAAGLTPDDWLSLLE